jgi:hypothetical protein
LITVFAPTDSAFAQLPPDTLRALRRDTVRLARFLRAHLFVGAAIDTTAIQAFIRGAARPGPQGSAFGFHTRGAQIDVDRLDSCENGRVVARATIVGPELQTTHGLSIAYGIDHVLAPVGMPTSLSNVLLQQGYVAVPLHRREDGNGYYVQAHVNNVPLLLTIETGTPVAVALDHHTAQQLHLLQDHDYAVALDSVKLGPIAITSKDLSAPMQAVERQGYRTTVGIVGSHVLARYHAVVDYGRGVLYLKTR